MLYEAEPRFGVKYFCVVHSHRMTKISQMLSNTIVSMELRYFSYSSCKYCYFISPINIIG